jgi:hypothetical protein
MAQPKFKTTAIQVAKMTDLKLSGNNPRYIRDEKFQMLVKSMKEFSSMAAVKPIVINAKNEILGGNMRFRAAQELKWTEIPVIVATFESEAEEKEFMIKDNTHFGEWDTDVLANEWADVNLLDWGVTIGFASNDYLNLDGNGSAPKDTHAPRATDDDYSVFEVVMQHDKKLKLIAALTRVKDDHGLDKTEDALVLLAETYLTK